MNILLIALSFVLGTVMGSFGGVLLDRWENLKSMLTGRSMCLDCKHPLAIKDLVPLISYLSTGGRCRYCGVKIPISCPINEIIMGVVFALTTWRILWSGSDYLIITLIAWWMINWSLTLMSIHDHNTQYLHWSAWIVAVIIAVGYTLGRQSDMMLLCLYSSLILAGVFMLVYLSGYVIHWIKYRTREQGFGIGDVLLAWLLGWITPLALGYDTLNLIGEGGILVVIQLVLGYLVASSTIGLVYRYVLWTTGEQEVEIAFIPGMVIGYWLYLIAVVGFGLFI